jgi:tetratricopeptide (TPR) repeat protein
VSLDELGIQLFARERYEDALEVFTESRKIFSNYFGSSHPRLCMVVNNIACCMFGMGNPTGALLTMNEARAIQQTKNASSSAKADLDLLYLAILLNNFGYLKVNVKQYEEARACFEEALLVSQFERFGGRYLFSNNAHRSVSSVPDSTVGLGRCPYSQIHS